MAQSKIEWTERVWNPVTGCTKVSQGCKNCYAERQALAHQQHPNPKIAHPYRNGFGVTLHPDRLHQPLHWRKPSRIFVNSMSDLFHQDVPDHFIAAVFGVMASCPQHTFQVLTKRPQRMLEWFQLIDRARPECRECQAEICRSEALHAIPNNKTDGGGWHPRLRSLLGYDTRWPLPNVWLGVSTENQETADQRIPQLLQTPAVVRFVSCEPLLGPVDLAGVSGGNDYLGDHWDRNVGPGIDWVIAGGESGPGARPMHLDWARSLRDQCAAARVPFFFKQWGEWAPIGTSGPHGPRKYDVESGCTRVGKTAAGNHLDGRKHLEFPTL